MSDGILSPLNLLFALLFVPITLGTMLGYILVRAWIWAWPSMWQLLRPEGRTKYRETRTLILTGAPSHLPWRASFYAFRELRHHH